MRFYLRTARAAALQKQRRTAAVRVDTKVVRLWMIIGDQKKQVLISRIKIQTN